MNLNKKQLKKCNKFCRLCDEKDLNSSLLTNCSFKKVKERQMIQI